MNRAATIALAPVSGIYGIIVRARNALYRNGVLKIQDVGAPVISVGNLTAGGTGKTPLVEWIAREVSSQPRKVCVLTRGYARQNPQARVVASDGKQVLAAVGQTGDEAFMLAEHLLGEAAVICDADRVAAARWAIENLGTEVFVLDDAFQHQKIARNLNLVVVDAANPWGNGWMLPGGRLREPINQLSRADGVVITRANSPQVADLRRQIEQLNPRAPIFTCRLRFNQLRDLATDAPLAGSSEVKASPVAAFCAIGNPKSFFSLLSDEGLRLVYRQTRPDHHTYMQADVEELTREAGAKGAHVLLTTAKDAVKLRSFDLAMPCYVVETALEIDEADSLRRLLAESTAKA